MRISDWSSDVCSSDLAVAVAVRREARLGDVQHFGKLRLGARGRLAAEPRRAAVGRHSYNHIDASRCQRGLLAARPFRPGGPGDFVRAAVRQFRSEEHTSELQSLMRISYAVFCLKKKIR